MSLPAYAMLGLTALIAVLIAVLVFAAVRLLSAARHNRIRAGIPATRP